VRVGGGGQDTLVCGVGTNADCYSVDYAIYSRLDRSLGSNSVINVVGNTTLRQSVECTGEISSLVLQKKNNIFIYCFLL
jgi:hypothetical protein